MESIALSSPQMPRRLLVPDLHPGLIELPPAQAHHARDVLRLTEGAEVELFTAAGETALATLTSVTARCRFSSAISMPTRNG